MLHDAQNFKCKLNVVLSEELTEKINIGDDIIVFGTLKAEFGFDFLETANYFLECLSLKKIEKAITLSCHDIR